MLEEERLEKSQEAIGKPISMVPIVEVRTFDDGESKIVIKSHINSFGIMILNHTEAILLLAKLNEIIFGGLKE